MLWRSRTPMHQTDYYSYDSYGNRTSSRRVDYRVYTDGAAENAYPYIRTENTYTTDGNYTATAKDARGNTVSQSVNVNDGTLTSVTDPEGQMVNYTYDASKRVTSVQTTGDGKTYKNAYTYEDDRIKTVSHNTTSDTSNDVTYTFAYDELGRKTAVKVGNQTLSTNVYENNRNGLLSEVKLHGNGGKVGYTYDEFDRLISVKNDGEMAERYSYEYGANGKTAKVTDNELGRTARTDYDLAARPCQTELIDNATDEVLYKTRLKYDKLNNLQRFSEKIGEENHRSEYTYDRDNRVTEITYDGNVQKVTYVYDELGRITSRVAECGADAGKLTSTYTYVDGGYGTNSTTPLVKKITQEGISFEYAYDSRGNITSEKRGELTTTYQYDAIGQLIRVNDPHENTSWVYNYDRGGNITSKVKYAYTSGTLGTALETIPYTYGDSNWKDKLTSYNGQAITYDAIGNPLNDGNWTYEWQAGRQLKRMSTEGTSVSFEYDHNGLRTQKVLEHDWYPETTNYTLHGKLITHMTVDYTDLDEVPQQDNLHFFYDSQSRPAKVSFNGEMYTYVHNLQGDTVGILDSLGMLVVEYKYDAWGKLLDTTGTLADTLGKRNPFRYRGYVFDEETRLYYLRSRYYNSETVRFINCDEIYADQSDELFDHNKYVYVNSCPTNRKDEDGYFWHIAIGAVVGGLVSAVGSVVSQAIEHKGDFSKIDAGEIVAAGIAGAFSGALAATGVGVAGQIVGNALISGAENVANQTFLADEPTVFDPVDLVIDMAIGGLGGALGGNGASVVKNGKGTVRMTSHITSLTRRTNRRIVRGLKSGSASTVKKAIVYYKKNTRVLYTQLKTGLVKGLAVSSTYRIVKPVYQYFL